MCKSSPNKAKMGIAALGLVVPVTILFMCSCSDRAGVEAAAGNIHVASLVCLIANPQVFDGRTVATQGYFIWGERDGKLYLSSGDEREQLWMNGIYIHGSIDELSHLREQHNKYVDVTGQFSASKPLWSGVSGSLRNVSLTRVGRDGEPQEENVNPTY